jgi:flagellar FliG-like protein
MGMIDRYKKKGGFLQLVQVIETTPAVKQEKFLTMMNEEAPKWAAEVRSKILTLDKIFAWEMQYITQVVLKLPQVQLVAFYNGLLEERKNVLLKTFTYKEKKAIEESIAEGSATRGGFESSTHKIYNEIRNQIGSGELRLDKVDISLIIPPNIEDILSAKGPASGATPGGPTEAPAGGSKFQIQYDATSMPSTDNLVNLDPAKANAFKEELNKLKTKLTSLSQENQKLHHENQVLKSKIDQIKKIA